MHNLIAELNSENMSPVVMNFIYALIIMLIAGILGGLVNYHFTPNEKNEPNYLSKCIIVGIGASFILPLFLYLIRSELLNDILSESQTAGGSTDGSPNSVGQLQGFLVFFSFCLLAAISAFKFIPALSDKFLELVERVESAEEKATTAEEKATQAEEKASTAEEKATENRETLKAVKEKIVEKNPIKPKVGNMVRGPALQAIGGNPIPCGNTRPIVNPDDPEKGRWGGEVINNNRKVTAQVKPIDKDEDWFKIILAVTSTDPVNDPLIGDVVFFLHDSFSNSVEKVLPKNGKATLSLIAWGAFTVGICVEGNTELEIDLASNDVDAPDSFKER
jgi:hypothetical protein